MTGNLGANMKGVTLGYL